MQQPPSACIRLWRLTYQPHWSSGTLQGGGFLCDGMKGDMCMEFTCGMTRLIRRIGGYTMCNGLR